MKALPWFRMYHEALDDEKLGLLAFEDRWHFVAILCLKCRGVLDSDDDFEMLTRKVALKMGLTCAELEKVSKRLARMGLIDAETYQPVAWEGRQMQSDTSADRTKAYRERMKRHSDVTVTVQEEDTDTDKEVDKEKEKKRATSVATPDGVSDSVFQDYQKLRKAKKSPLTQTALNALTREAAKAGLPLATVLEMCCERGWVGFKAEWVQEKRSPYLPPQPNETKPSRNTPDPELERIKRESAMAAPIPDYVRQLTKQLTGKAA